MEANQNLSLRLCRNLPIRGSILNLPGMRMAEDAGEEADWLGCWPLVLAVVVDLSLCRKLISVRCTVDDASPAAAALRLILGTSMTAAFGGGSSKVAEAGAEGRAACGPLNLSPLAEDPWPGPAQGRTH